MNELLIMNEFKYLVILSGLKHEKIAELLKISVDSVNSYNAGRRKAPKSVLRDMGLLKDAICQKVWSADREKNKI